MAKYENLSPTLVDGTITPEGIHNLEIDMTKEVANEHVANEQAHLSVMGDELAIQEEISNFEGTLKQGELEESRRFKEEAEREKLSKIQEEKEMARGISDLEETIKGDITFTDTVSRPVYADIAPPVDSLANVKVEELKLEEKVPKVDNFGRPIPEVPKKSEKDAFGREIEDPWDAGFGR